MNDTKIEQDVKEEILVGSHDYPRSRLLQKCLTHVGYRVSVCKSLATVEESLAKTIPDLLILDYDFDNLPGMEAGRRILVQKPYSDIPLLMMVFKNRANGMQFPVEFAKKYVSWAPMPYTPEMIRSEVSSFFARKREAEQMKERALERIHGSPNAPDGYILLGRSLQQLHNAPDAITACEMAVQKDPDNAEAYTLLADIYSGQRNHEAAVYAYSQLARLQPTNANNLRDLGYALVSVGEREKAQEVWTRALEYADPSIQRALLVVLENMKARERGR